MSEKNTNAKSEDNISEADIDEVTSMLNDIEDDIDTIIDPVIEDDAKPAKIKEAPIIIEATPEIITAQPIENDKLGNYVVDLLESFKETDSKILTHFDEDRKEIQDVITHLRSRVFGDDKPQRVYVEMLVQALKIKSDTNANAIKLLDSKAKLLASGKPHFTGTQEEGTYNLSELEKLLGGD